MIRALAGYLPIVNTLLKQRIKRILKPLLAKLLNGSIPVDVNPRQHQPSLSVPEGISYEDLLGTMISFAIDSTEEGVLNGIGGELENYARQDFERFLHTLALVPPGKARVLEIGANPYFTTYLIKRFRPEAELVLANSFGGEPGEYSQVLAIKHPDGRREILTLPFHNCNIETTRMPHPDAYFDVVIFCEVIEHLTEDPVKALLEIKRILRPGGMLILSTPNVSRLENVAKMIAGANVYDPYSGYGPYGRHNREYNKHEIWTLMRYCGFRFEKLFTADVHANMATAYADMAKVAPLINFRNTDLGQYIFATMINDGPAPARLPGWLYRSLPAERLDNTPL